MYCRCSKCKFECSLEDGSTHFTKSSKNANGFQSWCRKCVSLAGKNTVRRINTRRNYHLNKLYGFSVKQYDELLLKQNYMCAICGSKEANSSTAKFFYVDHDHITKKVRGLLCHKCNFGLGQFNDSIELLNNAINYLESNK